MTAVSRKEKLERLQRTYKTLIRSSKKHRILFFLFAGFLHFSTWKILTELSVSLPQYFHDQFGAELFDLGIFLANWILVSALYVIILAVATITWLSREFRSASHSTSAEEFLKQGIEELRAVRFPFDVARSFCVLWRTVVRVFFTVAFVMFGTWVVLIFIRWITGKGPYSLEPVFLTTTLLLAFSYALAKCTLAIPITVIEGRNAEESIRRSTLLTSFRRSKPTLFVCIFAYFPALAVIFFSVSVDSAILVKSFLEWTLLPLALFYSNLITKLSSIVGNILEWALLTVAIFLGALISTGWYLYLRPGS